MKNLIVLLVVLPFCFFSCMVPDKLQIIVKPDMNISATDSIQLAIDKCAANGGGTVVFLEGVYLTGGLEIKSNVVLQLVKGVVIRGSDQYREYSKDALIFGENATGFSIQGEGIIDGVDCFNPRGEEGFRGPHCIKLRNCSNFSIRDITIRNSGNWAINCRNCSDGVLEKVFIRGGHDGLHTRFCNNFKVTGCDFRTGDDAFAGNDNKDFFISDCYVNTSCNGFRLGCLNLIVQKCSIKGPGEYVHKSQNRNNMLSAFVHFSPKDENPVLKSGNWTISDITVENADHFYIYNFNNGLWQTGQPATSVSFERIKATGILTAFNVIGDSSRSFSLHINNSSFEFRDSSSIADSLIFEGVLLELPTFLNISNFNSVELNDVVLTKNSAEALTKFSSGNSLTFRNTHVTNDIGSDPFLVEMVDSVRNEN